MFWSYLLTAVGVFGLFLVTRNNKLGWYIGITAQGLWITYAIATHQYGFIISALVYASVNFLGIRNFKKPPAEQCDSMSIWRKNDGLIIRCADKLDHKGRHHFNTLTWADYDTYVTEGGL